MAGNLIIPRVECFWGKDCLTLYNKGPFQDNPQPLVYNIAVELADQGQNPTGSFSWNTSGPGFQVYESFVSSNEKLAEEIVIRYFYANGKSIPLYFVWGGQKIVYGTDMSVSVVLKTTLDGLINSNERSIAQPNDKKKSYSDHVFQTADMFGVDKYRVQMSKEAEKDMKKAKIKSYYAKDVTFGSAVNHLAWQNGNYLINGNIGSAAINIVTPHTWGEQKEVLEASPNLQMNKGDMAKCYGYLLGPGMFETVSKDSEWQPPQMTTTDTVSMQTKPTEPQPGQISKQTQTPTSSPQTKTKESAKPTPAPLGTSNASPNPGVRNADNPFGPDKQIALQQENSSKMTVMAFMCPVLTGIKPGDMVYIPSLRSNSQYIEDWIVDGVGYDQTDGGVILTISGHRTYGLGTLMQPGSAQKFVDRAKSLKTLEDWQKYAWPESLKG